MVANWIRYPMRLIHGKMYLRMMRITLKMKCEHDIRFVRNFSPFSIWRGSKSSYVVRLTIMIKTISSSHTHYDETCEIDNQMVPPNPMDNELYHTPQGIRFRGGLSKGNNTHSPI